MRDFGNDAEIVRDEQDAVLAALAQLLDEFQDLRLRGDVERVVARRRSAAPDRAPGRRDHDALALSAGG